MERALLTACIFFFSALTSQAQTYVWAEQISGSSYQMVKDADTDPDGNVYVAGWMIGNSTFDSISLTGLSYDGFVGKYNDEGAILWAQRIGSSSYDGAFHVATDDDGNVVVAGWFYGATCQIGDTSVSGTLNTYDTWLAKWDSVGNLQWAKSITGGGYKRPIGLATDPDGNVVIQVGFQQTLFAGSSSFTNSNGTQGTSGYYDEAIVRYDPDGNFMWKVQIESPHIYSNNWYWEYSGGLDVDANYNIYAASSGSDTLSVGSSYQTAYGGYDAFIIKLDSSGSVSWIRNGGGTSTDYVTDLKIDNNNKIFISGMSYNSILFGSQSATGTAWGPFVAQYNASGTAQYAVKGSGLCYLNKIDLDNEGNFYLTGLMYSNTNMSLGSITVTNPSGSGYTPYYIKRDYSSNSWEWGISPTVSPNHEYVGNITAHDEDHVYGVGSFLSSVTFGSTALSGTSYEGFVTKIANCDYLVAQAYAPGNDTSICDGDEVEIYTDTNSLYEYQWLYNGAVLAGETNPTLTVDDDGLYSMVIDSGGCVDTSNVLNIIVNALPSVTHSNFSSVCDADDPFTLTGGSPSGGTYNGTGVSGGSTFDPGSAALGNNTIWYVYTDSNTCKDSVSKTLTVNSSPAIFTTTISACEGDSPISLAGAAYGFPTGGTHSGNGVTGNSFDPGSAGAGTHSIFYSSSNGCLASDSIVATVTASPTVSLDTFADVCVSASGFALSGGSPTGGTYAGLGVFGAFYYPAFAGSGTHQITYTISASGCSNVDTSSITVDPAATSSISTLPDLCEDDDTLGLLSYGTPSGGAFSGTGVSSNIFDPSVSSTGTFTITYTFTNACGTATDTESLTVNDLPSLSMTSSNVSCNGGSDGSATVSATNGSPFTYSWSNGASSATASSLTAGTYTVTVTNANTCLDTISVTITEPTAISVGTSMTPTSCNGGSDGIAAAFASGGTSPYTYSWSNGSSGGIVTGLAAGTYTVTAEDDNSCTETATVTVTEPTAVLASISASNVSCNGSSDGSATASASGGTSPYTYAWSNAATGATATGLAAGTYTVTVEDDNGCADTETVTITEPATLVASVSSSTNASCNGACDGTATATATGGTTAYSYSWSNGGSSATTTGLCAGTFTVTVEDDNGCIDTETVTITAPTTMNASASVDTSASCSGSSDGVATANGSGGSIPYSYNWSNGDSTATATGLTSGTHTVTVTDNNGCTDTAMVNMGTLDTVGPTQITHAFQTYYLDSTGSVIIAVANVDSASTDVCGIDTMYLSQYSFDCGDVGVNSVTFTAEDEAGNVSSITVPISIIDSQPPVVLANWMISVHLDSAGMVTINADTVDSASYDNCGIQSMWLSDSVFSCADTATLNVVTLYVQDGSGNVDSTTCNILVIDSMPPSVIPHNTITYHLDSTGNVAFDRDTVDSATYDNCGIAARYLSDSIFSCSDTGTINYVTLYARDRSGNVDSAIVEVIIVDSQPPSVVAHSWILVHLDSTGMVVFDRDTVDSATSDNCSISARWLSDSNFTCADTGWNTITFYARDRSGNVDSMLAEVFIVDTMPPFVTGSGDTLYLDANGMAVIDTAAMNISVYDNCQVDWVQFTIDTFYCADVGTNNWQVVASDVSGNVDSLNLSIVVADTFAPTVNAQNISVYLDSFGMATVDTTMVNAGAYDNCGIDSMWLAQQNFNCADTTGGTINWLYAVDGNGNVDSASFVISVIDTIAPNLVAQNDTIYLDSSGVTSIDTSLISSAFDNCGLDTLYFSQSSFTCADSGVNSITVTAIDESGNQTDVQIIVTVLDTIAPFVNSYSSITVYVNSTGVAYLNTAMFDDGSNDNCQIDSLSISMDSLTCSSANPTVITLTGIDVSGNSASDTTIVTIVDTTLNVSLTIVEDSVCQGAMVALDSVSTSGGVYSGMGISGDTLYTDTLLGWQYITYTVTNSSGCSDFAVDSVFITGNPTVSVDPGSFVLCAGEMMTLNFASPLGGIYVSQFADSNMLTAPDSAYSGIGGYYTFSNSCGTDTGEFYLQVIPAPEIDLGPDTSLCNAYQLTFDAGTHTSYLWSTGATSQMITINDGEEPLTEDQTIWVTVTNEEGCTNSDTLFVDVMDQPTFYLGDNFTICRDSAVVLTVPNVYDSFIWSDSNTGITILAHDGSAIIPGLYTFWATGTNAGGCSYSDTIVINLKDCSPEGLEAVHLPEGIDVYPNPTASELNIALLQGSVDHIDQIRMVDIRGSQAALFNPSDWSLTSSGEYVMINVSNLANGVYVLQVVHDQGVHSERVIIER